MPCSLCGSYHHSVCGERNIGSYFFPDIPALNFIIISLHLFHFILPSFLPPSVLMIYLQTVSVVRNVQRLMAGGLLNNDCTDIELDSGHCLGRI
jgi:hypothetical protein